MNVTLLLSLVIAAAPSPTAVPAGPPSAAVLVVRRMGVSPEDALERARQISKALAGLGVAVVDPDFAVRRLIEQGRADPTSCGGQAACAVELGKRVGAEAVVAMEVGALRKTLAVHLEAVRISDGKVVARQDLLAQEGGLSADVLASLDAFARSLRDALPPPKPLAVVSPAPADLPRSEPVAPAPATNPEYLPAKPSPTVQVRSNPRRKLAWATGALTIAAGVAAGALGVVGRLEENNLGGRLRARADGWNDASVSRLEAERMVRRANNDYTAATVTGASAAVLAAVTAFLWVVSEKAP
jgi:hypothetical protein